jgi:hypothetical protein
VLDSGEFGPTLYITKSVTISADGVSATIATPTARKTSIIVNNATAVVALRGLLVIGGGKGLRGIAIVNAASIYIEKCEVERFVGDGIVVHNVATRMYVSDSVSRLNRGRGLAYTGTAGASLVIENSHFDDNGASGVEFTGPIETSISSSTLAGNRRHGVSQTGGTSVLTRTAAAHNAVAGFAVEAGEMTLEESIASANDRLGFFVAADAIGRISNSTFTQNNIGIQNDGTVETLLNNTVAGGIAPVVGNAFVSLPPT